MKTISIAGTIGRDAETRDAGQSRKTSFSVAVDDGWGENKSTLWFDCSIWGQRGEKVAQYLTKGGKISLSGELGTRENNGKTYLQIRVAEFDLPVNKRDDRQGNPPPAPRDLGEEIPF